MQIALHARRRTLFAWPRRSRNWRRVVSALIGGLNGEMRDGKEDNTVLDAAGPHGPTIGLSLLPTSSSRNFTPRLWDTLQDLWTGSLRSNWRVHDEEEEDAASGVVFWTQHFGRLYDVDCAFTESLERR